MNTRQRFWRKAAASAALYTLIFGQTVQPAQAASTDISDVPMAVKNLVAPNIMVMIDNSGSMNNIVPDTPFDPAITYLASCPAANVVAGGFTPPPYPSATAFDIRISNGVTRIRIGTTNFVYGTGAGQKCFDPALRYNTRLSGNGSSTSAITCGIGFTPCFFPSGYLDAVYTGNYLNWYFGDPATGYTTAINFGAGASRKPGTQNRIEIARIASKLVLDALDTGKVRVGLSTYNSGDGGSLREIMGNLSSNKTSMKTKIDALVPSGNTPLAETLSDLGRYFATGYTGNLTIHPGQANQASVPVSTFFTAPGRATSALVNNSGQTIVAPIQFFCQRSFAMFMTDGQSQGDQNMSTYLNNYKGECPVPNPTANVCVAGTPGGSPDNFGRKVGRNYESAGSDYLDDVAKALFEIDLRPDLQPPAGSGIIKSKNNVITYPIGFADEQVIADPLMQETAGAGGGLFLTAGNAAQLVQAFQQAAEDILSKDGSAAAVAVANANVIAGDNASYASSYNSGTWTGDLIAYPVNLTTGQPDVNNPIWNTGCADPNALVDASDPAKGKKGCSAQTLLDLRTAASRKIASYTGTTGTSQGIQFQPTTATTATKLSAAQQTLLDTAAAPPGPSDGAAVVNYLRGDRSGETAGTYRTRARLMGDIINAEPVVIREPVANYADAGYSAFKTGTAASRTRIVVQGANDGMVHAFNTATGAEEWAYVPNLVMANLNNLSRKSGFVHRYYVDGTPVSGDVDFSKTDGVVGNPPPDWRTLVAGGLGKGGRGYYALDVTSTTVADEAALAGKVLWEFPNSATSATVRANIGFSFGRPIIIKTKARGWVVLVTSGYNNGTNAGDSGGDGQGYLFVLNARTGDLIKAIGTGAGTATDPSGLTHISGYVEAGDVDNTVEYVYGGDLKGNVWRFDLTDVTNPVQWSVTKLTTLVDSLGNFQPVTTEPELTKVNIGGGVYKRFVYVGTGLYLGDTDIPGAVGANIHASQTQTMYGLVDDLFTPTPPTTPLTPVITPLRSSLQQQTLTVNADGTRTASANAVNFLTQKGWYLDLPSTGERANTHPALALGALIFTTNIPSSTQCVPGGSSFFNVLDYKTGGYLTGSTVPWSSVSLGSALASRAVLIKLPTGAVMGLARKSDASTVTVQVPLPASSTATKRRSWKELI